MAYSVLFYRGNTHGIKVVRIVELPDLLLFLLISTIFNLITIIFIHKPVVHLDVGKVPNLSNIIRLLLNIAIPPEVIRLYIRVCNYLFIFISLGAYRLLL